MLDDECFFKIFGRQIPAFRSRFFIFANAQPFLRYSHYAKNAKRVSLYLKIKRAPLQSGAQLGTQNKFSDNLKKIPEKLYF